MKKINTIILLLFLVTAHHSSYGQGFWNDLVEQYRDIGRKKSWGTTNGGLT
jgi:hypothetical protein